MSETRFEQWMAELEARHLANLTFPEVTRALRALSGNYVERRQRLASQSALDSAGKRAAYALYYNPLHFLTIDRILQAVDDAKSPVGTLMDLGCGAGAAGAAWGARLTTPTRVVAVDVQQWALGEASRTYQFWSLPHDVSRGSAVRAAIGTSIDAVVAGWMLNELDEPSRATVQRHLLRAAERGTAILVVEPIATRVAPWWKEWTRPFAALGSRVDEWRFRVELPALVKKLDRAASMRHDELTARSLYLTKR